jgi:general secretion pathway protein F
MSDRSVDRNRASTTRSIGIPGQPAGLRTLTSSSATVFASDLASMLGAGLNQPESLRALYRDTSSARYRPLAGHCLEHVTRGSTLSSALDSSGQVPAVLCATVRAGEHSGSIVTVLQRYVTHARRMEHLRHTVLSALLYPALVALLGLAVLAFILFFLVPRLSGVYASSSRPIPLFSRWLFSLGELIAQHPGWIALGAAMGVATAVGVAVNPAARAAVKRVLHSAPVIGAQLQLIQLGRLYRTLGLLLASGLSLRKAIEVCIDASDTHISSQLQGARTELMRGGSIEAAFRQQGLTTPAVESLLAVGERSGSLGPAFDRIAEHLEGQSTRGIDATMRLVEPLIVLILSIGVGGLLLLMYMPIFEVAGGLF